MQEARNTKLLQAEKRRMRLAVELRSNLKKRREQVRGRGEQNQPAGKDEGRDETRQS